VVSELTAAERAQLARIATVLLPDGSPGPPLELGPALADAVRRALRRLDGADLAAAVPALVDAGGPEAAALLLVVSAGHYADPQVRAALGYPGPQPIPLPPLPDPDDAELDALLERVRARGPIYRDA
jgi:hypothetical protein